MKSLVLFAHYDRHSIVDDHVIHYLTKLRQLGDVDIVFVSDTDALRSADVLAGLCVQVHAQRQPSFDFGSWRIGWKIANETGLLGDADRLVLVNDSVYAPMFPLQEMWDTFTGADMYGSVENIYLDRFFEGFFLVFDLSVKVRNFLQGFWDRFQDVDHDMWKLIQQYEVGMSVQAREAGLLQKAFVPAAEYEDSYRSLKNKEWSQVFPPDDTGGPTWFFWYGLICYHRFPFLKVKMARIGSNGFEQVVQRYTDYPFNLIESHVKRVNAGVALSVRGDPRIVCDRAILA